MMLRNAYLSSGLFFYKPMLERAKWNWAFRMHCDFQFSPFKACHASYSDPQNILSRIRTQVLTAIFSLPSKAQSNLQYELKARSPPNDTSRLLDSLIKSEEPKKNNSSENSRTYFIRPDLHPPIYPIVLCHGLFGFDKMGYDSFPSFQIQYWRGISSKLREIGCKVFEARVPSTGSVNERAMALKLFIEAHGLSDVNFIAHSMGGLDCRYLISKLNPSFRVHTLTTISTPHRGSSFMDWCSNIFGIGKTPPLPKIPLTWVDFPAYANLTTAYCSNVLNVEVQDQPTTRYYSYGACYPIPFWSPLWFPSEIIKSREGENDGLVSVQSAKWGTYLATLPTDHWGITNRWFSPKINTQFDAADFYLHAATRLWQEGF